MVVNEQDVVSGLDVPMLIGIVQQDDVHILCRLVCEEAFYAVTPVGIHSDIDLWELLLYLPRLVAYLLHCRGEGREDVAS